MRFLMLGLYPPPNVACPVNTTGWVSDTCDTHDHFNQPVGPGLFGVTLNTIAGHYYAIAIIIFQGISNGGSASYTFDTSTPQLDGVDFTRPVNCPGVLPVKLSSFNAAVNNCSIHLDWTATSQSDIKDYEVQSSIDGIKFQTIATIGGTTHGSDQKYSYRDDRAKQGNIYYRLKMTGIDGKFDYSKIIPLKLNCNPNSFVAYPNPVSDILNVSIPNVQNYITIAKLFETNGKLIYSGEMIAVQILLI